jgi:hypothetical protein
MSSPAEMAERHGRMLAELAELGLGLARELHGRALSAETPQETAQLADAFQRLSRSVRQSLALEAKLQRDARRDAHEFGTREREARKAQLEKRVERLIRDEVADRSLAFQMAREAPDYVEREAESERFLDEPVEAQVARIRAALGVGEEWDFDDEDEAADDADLAPAREAPADPPPAPPRPPWPFPNDDWQSSA